MPPPFSDDAPPRTLRFSSKCLTGSWVSSRQPFIFTLVDSTSCLYIVSLLASHHRLVPLWLTLLIEHKIILSISLLLFIFFSQNIPGIFTFHRYNSTHVRDIPTVSPYVAKVFSSFSFFYQALCIVVMNKPLRYWPFYTLHHYQTPYLIATKYTSSIEFSS